ncbi:MAG: hypothetical protein J0L96_03705 [Anaerolineae bacterium]|nr:hypothetical protein [Anaerolineae bacterium]
MMFNHTSPYERVTAWTDVLMGLLAGFIAFQLSQISSLKFTVWIWAFGLLAISAFLGAVAHGYEMTRKTNDRLWMPINLSLGLALGLFVVGALFDLSGEAIARMALPVMLAIGFGFFLITVWKPGTFMTFIAYEAIAMLFALGVYVYLLFTSSLAGAGWMVTGVLVTVIAAAVQATGKAGKGIFWYFDNNGVFHIIQMAGMALLYFGLNT